MKKRHYLTLEDIERARHMIEVDGLQQRKVADEIGVHQGTIEKLVKRLGLKAQRTGPRSGAEHPDWKGGRKISKGYVYIYSPDHPCKTKQGYVLEHRLVMEKILGRYLLLGEVVHHRDGNRQNSDPDNLMVFQTNGEHLRYELQFRIPKWTPEGKQRIVDAVRKRVAIYRQSKESGGGRPLQPIAHPTSGFDSTDEGQAS